jgi:glucokinase
MSVLSLDLGGSHISCALVAEGRIEGEARMPTAATRFAEVCPEVEAMLRSCAEQASVPARGMAMGYCGIVDGRSGEVLSTLNKYTDLPGIDLCGWAQRTFGLPLRLENDAALALLGEASYGAARGAADVVMITLGTGIGGAAMVGGQMLRSRFGQAGCLGGHLTVNFRGRQCVCGAVGCAEAEASTSVLPVICRESPEFASSRLASEPVLDFEVLFRLAEEGDRLAQQVADHCVAVWSALTVSLVHAYGPELVLFGGGVMHAGERVLAPIRDYVGRHMWTTVRGVPRIEGAQLGSKAALFGGATLFES